MARAERSHHNFQIIHTATSVIKRHDGTDKRLRGRLTREAAALHLVSSQVRGLIPLFKSYDPQNHEIETGRIGGLGRGISTDHMIGAINILQRVEGRGQGPLPTLGVSDYRRQTAIRLRFLRTVGRSHGISAGLTMDEVERLGERYEELIGAVEPFDTVFVHSDIQKRHLARNNDGGVTVIDFDQAHFGSELEDFAFTSIRHPRSAKGIRRHLERKFADDPEKSANLEAAFEAFQLHFLIKGYFDRTYQYRGKPYDIAAKAYGRVALRRRMNGNIFSSQASHEQFMRDMTSA